MLSNHLLEPFPVSVVSGWLCNLFWPEQYWHCINFTARWRKNRVGLKYISGMQSKCLDCVFFDSSLVSRKSYIGLNLDGFSTREVFCCLAIASRCTAVVHFLRLVLWPWFDLGKLLSGVLLSAGICWLAKLVAGIPYQKRAVRFAGWFCAGRPAPPFLLVLRFWARCRVLIAGRPRNSRCQPPC